jgi:hypothetical protein
MESLSNILRNDIIGLVVFVVSVMMPFFLLDVVVPIVFPHLCPKCGSYFYKTATDYLAYDD